MFLLSIGSPLHSWNKAKDLRVWKKTNKPVNSVWEEIEIIYFHKYWVTENI
jgi:hypothetical protein